MIVLAMAKDGKVFINDNREIYISYKIYTNIFKSYMI